MSPEVTPGERYLDRQAADFPPSDGEHLWATLGFRRTEWQPGSTTIEWDATPAYCIPASSGPIVHGGMVSTVLDSAMGGACWTVLDRDQVFLTADLRVEFHRSARPGLLRATGTVVRRTRRVVFCAAELFDTDGTILAASRCTQVLLPADGKAGRYT